jgi:1-acyl-sn-glycerol-3-phosphate acyltransferase
MFFHSFPPEDPTLKNQTELTDIDDDTYHKGYTAHSSTTADRIIQIIFFLVFFGWLRFILFLISAITMFIVLIPLALLCDSETGRLLYYPFAAWYGRHFFFPFGAACLGIYRIRWHGVRDARARCLVYNHVSLLDGPFVYTGSQFTIVVHAGIQKLPIIGRALKGAAALFIDRAKSEGNAQILADAMNNLGCLPLAVAPEAKISSGEYLFRFRTGAFLTDQPIQPMTIRYTHFLPWAGISPNALPESDFEWFWMCFCCPGAVCDVTYLETVTTEQMAGKSPRERADMVQLIMANELGTLASSRSSHEIFPRKKKDA